MLVCCREFSANQTQKAGKFGTYVCDTPRILVEESFKFIHTFSKQQNIKPEFLFYLGDDPAHDNWEQTREKNLNVVKQVHDILVENNPGLRVFPVIANHDVFPVDQLDFPPKSNWYTNFVANLWSKFFNRNSLAQVRYAGYYSDNEFIKGLRIIGLNTQWMDPLNFYLYKNVTDPANQMAWLQNQLEMAERLNEKVYIIGHIPPGIKDTINSAEWIKPVQDKFDALIRRYHKIILFQSYGHVHVDSFRVFKDEHGQPINVALTNGGTSTWLGRNPVIRLFQFDKKDFKILDYLTFYADIEEANAKGILQYKLLYSFKNAYNLKDLSPSSYLQLARSFATNDELFNKFKQYKTGNRGTRCEGECKKHQLCAFENISVEDFYKCKYQ